MVDMHDELERLDSAIFSAQEAISNLECVDECDGIIDAINDRIRELQAERDTVHAGIEARDDAELDAMRDEYWRDAL